MSAIFKPIFLLVLANIFMTFAWYWHLKFKNENLWKVILISWLIAFVEYCLQIPANRMGYGIFTGLQLKILQEVVTLIVFFFFMITYLGESFRWNHGISFIFLILAVYFMFKS